MNPDPGYAGFEQGPIRPPSEADSLLIRVTRHCPWNHCVFCPVYKERRFSKRPVEHVIRDIDAVWRHVIDLHSEVRSGAGTTRLTPAAIRRYLERQPDTVDEGALQAALQWISGGMATVFLQDADSLVVGAGDILKISRHLRHRFPSISRITSYARSRTVARMAPSDLVALREAGLDRLHVGLESGSGEVLSLMRKGATPEDHVTAGRNIKAAGIELSEYVMPGLGGRRLSEAHALETAAVLNRVDPDFIRLRTLALPDAAPISELAASGGFEPCSGEEVVRETARMIDALEGISSVIVSDHILNLIPEVEGRLPEDKARILTALSTFLGLPENDRMLFQIGRRIGVFRTMDDLEDPTRRRRAEEVSRRLGVTPATVDAVITELTRRFI